MATESIASSVMNSLGGGSGIDILKLARDLTDVEQVPAEERINESKAKAEAKMEGECEDDGADQDQKAGIVAQSRT